MKRILALFVVFAALAVCAARDARSEAGSVDLIRGRDKVVRNFTSQDLKDGYAYAAVKQLAKSQVCGLRVNAGSLAFKFFAPYSGLVSIRPADLPSRCEPDAGGAKKGKGRK